MSSIPNLWICYSLNLILSKGWRSKRQLPLHGQWIFSALSETRSDHVIRTRQIKPNPCILLPYRRDNTASALSKPFMNLSTSVRRKLDSRSLLGWILFMPEGTNFQEVTESVYVFVPILVSYTHVLWSTIDRIMMHQRCLFILFQNDFSCSFDVNHDPAELDL